jgi:integrase
MSVRREDIRDPETGAVRTRWRVDVDYEKPDGTRARVRKVSPVPTRRGAEQYERELRASLLAGSYGRREEEAALAPTLKDFRERFLDEWCRANKQKPSGIDSKDSAFRNYLLPLFADRRLDTFTAADEDKLKKSLMKNAASTYNNAASALNMVLKAAARWKLVPHVPHRFMLLKRQKGRAKFYDFDEYEWLLEAAGKEDPRIQLVVLLGGSAGLRRGEMIALKQSDVDLRRGLLTVEQSEWKAQVTETKGMKFRVVPMTARLRKALEANRHLRGDRVLYTDAGETVTAKVLQKWMARAQKRAGLKAGGAIHILRHTFCSHLAMKGATALAIQNLAGHEDLTTTLGYMHLAQGETNRAIRLLDSLPSGHIAATEEGAIRNIAT